MSNLEDNKSQMSNLEDEDDIKINKQYTLNLEDEDDIKINKRYTLTSPYGSKYGYMYMSNLEDNKSQMSN